MRSLSAVSACCFLSLYAAYAATAVFDVSDPESARGLAFVENSQAPTPWIDIDGRKVLSAPIHNDYFDRKGIPFRVADDFPRDGAPAFLIIEHLDRNLGLIQVRYDGDRAGKNARRSRDAAYSTATALAGYTALGTGSPRRAVFRLDSPSFLHRQVGGADFQVEGVRSLTCVTLATALDNGVIEQAKREIPARVQSRLRLSRPMQLVMSVGADAQKRDGLDTALESMREICPLAAALGFTAVESYVKWNFVEYERGAFDWSYYDAVVAEARKHGLKWFPLLITGSAYTLPAWYHDSPDNLGYVCMEHGKRNNIQTIFTEVHTPYARRFMREFGEHYGPSGDLLGIRLGPSGNYGESQYPAGGNWGYEGETEHIHIGWWTGDEHAPAHFQNYLKKKYPDIASLNAAWEDRFGSFEAIKPFIPQFAETKRKRKDFVDWYMGAMTDWCERWAVWARDALPNHPVYQSSGGWGFVESGTDFTDQTASMAKTKGGIRTTNETDSYVQTFYATRMMSSAARFYGVPLGAEPAGYGSARGVVGRLFNSIVNNGQHLFYYHHNLLSNDQAIDKWLELAPLLDRRNDPLIEIAALYPDTMSKLDDGVFRNLYASTFNPRIAELRARFDFDFCSERMALDGALERYKALLLVWNFVVEADALNAIDAWVQRGGTAICADWRGAPITTVEGDATVDAKWRSGDTGAGNVIFIPDDREPPSRLARETARVLAGMEKLDTPSKRMLALDLPPTVYASVLKNGQFVFLNFDNRPASVSLPDGLGRVEIDPYAIVMAP
ncbi:MAG: hypothetical protein AMXMBFR4_04470 [Candidatus Hydrogenedentota bacterium]